WQLDDCWPVASWAGIDYYGRWKALHYAARRFFAPILLSPVEENGELRIYGVNDRRLETPGHLAVRVLDLDGHELWRKDRDVRLDADPAPTQRENYFTDNYFDLLPGESITVDWKGPPPTQVTARSIRDSY